MSDRGRATEAPAWESAETTPIAPVARLDAVVPAPAPPDAPKLFYRRGTRWPRAIAWFGFKSFWGHLWHLVASVIATEDIDSRNWMQPDSARALTRRLAETIGAGKPDAPTLSEALDDDVWIDFVADTGDDYSISEAVAKLIASRYEVEDPDDPARKLVLPRGHVLLFGGDTAYPVATDIEIHNRVIVPFNEVLRGAFDGKPRALLGIPGNHDWYGGLDGFGRMFRARRTRLDRVSRLPGEASPPDDRSVDRLGQIGHFIEWVEAFRVGTHVVKRAALALTGYTPVQSASYWSLRVAPDLDLWGVDRQLRDVDFAQRGYFAEERDTSRGLVLCVADPPYAFLEPNPAGQQTLDALDVTLKGDGLLVLTGDTHHYCRQTFGAGVQILAGGGGAFLHPQCIARGGLPEPDAEFPGPKTTLVLALQVPWQIAHGRSGFLVHTAVALTYIPLFGVQWSTGTSAPATSVVTAAAAALVCLFLGGWRHKPVRVGALSIAAGAVIGFLPLVVFEAVRHVAGWIGHLPQALSLASIAFVLSIYAGTLAIGTYLMLLTVLGIEQHQAFSALAHPGYKHFVRLRFRKDGSRADGWVFGRVDPLDDDDEVVLVDRFRWDNPAKRPPSA
ncbi:MAG: hypothetical protein KIS78_15780 [Labilithrix sp.]|nr:hypothetical protein [Labilithrix sp.]